jgi:F-type H+-transporting ATPase subunit gamma
MGAQLRVYRRRIRSVSATKKITRAQELIAASRIVKAQQRVAASKPYADELTRAVSAVATFSSTQHPLTTSVERPVRAAVLLVTSDRGFAGGYNSNAIKAAEQLTKLLVDEGKEVRRYVIGSKGIGFFQFREKELAGQWKGFSDRPEYSDAKKVAGELIDAFVTPTDEGGVDEIHLVSTEFVSMLTQSPVAVRVLPLAVEETDEPPVGGPFPLYDFEPSAEGVLDALLPRYVESRIFNALLQSAASEHAARRRAMKSATENADDLIKTLSRLANNARQSEITQEISEIVGGANALADANAGSD